jgi:hypothetical protein
MKYKNFLCIYSQKRGDGMKLWSYEYIWQI